MATIFTRIIRGEIPCHRILEDGRKVRTCRKCEGVVDK